MGSLEPTPVANPRIWALPRFSQNQTFSKAAGCAYRFHPRVYEIRLPQRHYLIFLELVALTININKKMLPIGVESLIIIQVTMPLWGTILISALPLDESQITRAAEEMIAEYDDEALSNADV